MVVVGIECYLLWIMFWGNVCLNPSFKAGCVGALQFMNSHGDTNHMFGGIAAFVAYAVMCRFIGILNWFFCTGFLGLYFLIVKDLIVSPQELSQYVQLGLVLLGAFLIGYGHYGVTRWGKDAD